MSKSKSKEKIISQEELAFPDMYLYLETNGLQITLTTLTAALDKLMNKRNCKDSEGLLILETLKGLLNGYKRRYESEDDNG